MSRSEAAQLVADLRRELEAELPIKLHEYAPANGRHSRGGPAEPSPDDIEPEPARPMGTFYNPGMTGLPFSRSFDRYLSGHHGGDFVAADSITEIREWCRREHWREQHTSENPFAWNLCARLVIAAVELRQPLLFIARQEGLDGWLAHNLLVGALQYAAQWRADRRKGVVIGDESRRQLNEAEALPVVLAREHHLGEEQKLWETLRKSNPCACGGALADHPIAPHSFMPTWHDELRRRRAFHAKHCAGGCELLNQADAA